MIDKNILKKEIENRYLDLVEFRVMDEFSVKRATKGVPTQDIRELLVLYELVFSWIEKILNDKKLLSGDQFDAEIKIFCIETIFELFNGGADHGEL